MRILFIHGMGTQDGCSGDSLIFNLSRTLGFHQVPPEVPDDQGAPCTHLARPKPTPVPTEDGLGAAQLYKYVLSDGHQSLTFMYLLWSPLTTPLKDTLREPDNPDHAALTTAIRSFENTHFTDVVAAGGKFRAVLRPVIERTLCLFAGGVSDRADPRLCDGATDGVPTVVITHSLGGYMLMDALTDLYPPQFRDFPKDAGRPIPDRRNAAISMGVHLDQIFMLANQVALLNLTTVDSLASTAPIAERFSATWDQLRQRRTGAGAGEEHRQLVAISDPNDILSWDLTAGDLTNHNFPVADVYLGTTGEFLGLKRLPLWRLAANPLNAHLNYLSDDDVMDIIACGMTGSTIKRCAPPR